MTPPRIAYQAVGHDKRFLYALLHLLAVTLGDHILKALVTQIKSHATPKHMVRTKSTSSFN